MRTACLTLLAVLGLAAWLTTSRAADSCCDQPGCAGCDARAASVARCVSSWHDKKSHATTYSMRCAPAGARAAECLCTEPSNCRCRPPCGLVYTQKKLFKHRGEETIEKVPKYEVRPSSSEPCDCARCGGGGCWWNPISMLRSLLGH